MKWVSVQSENFEPKRNVLWRKKIVEVELLGWYLLLNTFGGKRPNAYQYSGTINQVALKRKKEP
jgi:hypothetical protein